MLFCQSTSYTVDVPDFALGHHSNEDPMSIIAWGTTTRKSLSSVQGVVVWCLAFWSHPKSVRPSGPLTFTWIVTKRNASTKSRGVMWAYHVHVDRLRCTLHVSDRWQSNCENKRQRSALTLDDRWFTLCRIACISSQICDLVLLCSLLLVVSPFISIQDAPESMSS